MASGRGGTNTPNRRKIREKTSKCIQCDFLSVFKSALTIIRTICETLSSLAWGCQETIIGRVVYKKSTIFEVFWEYLSELWYFFVKSFLVARFYLVIVINIKILIIGALVTLGTRIKSPDFGHFCATLGIFRAVCLGL